jgi:hypothetical protein
MKEKSDDIGYVGSFRGTMFFLYLYLYTYNLYIIYYILYIYNKEAKF